ncbi:kynureninase [Kordiimonas marina]|uniref:kynureninase n=1 Tax=Kordiimonas marina TaxID=2872312 RepID=UPI001FF3BE30|nr:kynureninase [Kordiimonas marina]MCJ9427570.1 kynureninase [Kordiimonas marina]
MIPTDLDWCRGQDAADPLAHCRDRFDLPEGVIYLDGNSLGPLPKGVAERVQKVIAHEWRNDLIKSWNTADWVNLPTRVGAKIAPLVGAGAHQVVMADSTSVNLFKVAAAACKLNPGRTEILSEPGNFPTDLYMMQGLTDFLGPDYKLRTVPRGEIGDAIDENTAVVLLTHVHYVTADMYDMKAMTELAHENGALMAWDLSHSAGAVPLELATSGADFAVGCGYKYLNGGPGAPAFVYVADKHLKTARQPLSGWFGHKAPFEFVDDFDPADDVRRMLVGTPPVIGASALDAALDAFNGADMETIRRKSVALGDLFIALSRERLARFGYKVVTPENPRIRGSHVSLKGDNGYAVMQALIDRGVIGDFRAPDHMRFGFTPLYLGFEDVYRAVEILEDILETEAWRDPKYSARGAVT